VYPHKLPKDFQTACKAQGVLKSKWVLLVLIRRQTTVLFEHERGLHSHEIGAFRAVRCFRCSTSKFGIGQVAGSNCTPLGLHRVARKFGGGWPVGAVFKSRQMIGYTWQGLPHATIAHRILWLEGLEPGFNRGGNLDSFSRYIYLHGTADETSIGRPASHGCIHLAANDLIPMYDLVPEGTLVWISR